MAYATRLACQTPSVLPHAAQHIRMEETCKKASRIKHGLARGNMGNTVATQKWDKTAYAVYDLRLATLKCRPYEHSVYRNEEKNILQKKKIRLTNIQDGGKTQAEYARRRYSLEPALTLSL